MKKIILSGLLFLGVLSAQAQAQQGERTEYVFNPHWYVQVQPLGIQHTLGEVDFSDLNSYNVQAGVGYNFNKAFGARFTVGAWQSRAGISNKEWETNTLDYRYDKWKWNYIAPQIDLTANLSNIAFGVNPNRLFTLTAFIGVGLNIAWNNDEAVDLKYTKYPNYYRSVQKMSDLTFLNQNMKYCWSGTKVRFLGRAGLQGDFRITDKLSAGIEVNANMITDKYNSKRAGNADWYFNALAGIKYNLGKTHTVRVIPAPEPEIRYEEKIIYRDREVPANTGNLAIADEREPMRRDIFFLINKTNIRDTEKQKVIDIANYLKENPDAKVVMTGYADKGTGNARINARLAKQRSESVRNMLMKEFGIPADRITYDSKGDTEQPFAENDKNRVTVCIAE